MALTGTVDYGFSISPPLASGTSMLIAVDGTHHGMARSGTSTYIGDSESQTVHTTITQAQFRTDFAGLSTGASDTYDADKKIAFPGTPYFLICGGSSGSHATNDNVGVWYKINAAGNVTVDGGFYYKTAQDDHIVDAGVYGGAVAHRVIDGAYYGVMAFATLKHCLVWFPAPGSTTVNTGADAWRTRITPLEVMDSGPLTTGIFEVGQVHGRQYYNRATLIDDSSGKIGVIAFNWQEETGGANAQYTTVDPVARTATSAVSLTSAFGMPFSDELTLYTGSASTDGRDDYTAASNAYVTPLGQNELVFARTFSDNKQYCRIRRFTMSNASDITAVDTSTFQFTSASMSTSVEFVQFYREGANLQGIMRDSQRFLYGSLNLQAPGSAKTYDRVWG